MCKGIKISKRNDIGPLAVTLVGNSLIESLEMEFGSRQLLEVCERQSYLVGQLLAAQLFRFCRDYLLSPSFRHDSREVWDFLSDLNLDIKFDHHGHLFVEVEGYPTFDNDPYYEDHICYGSESISYSPRHRRERRGHIVYHIHNLTINLTADVIHQLNVNPKEVVNMIHERLKDEVENIEVHRLPPDKGTAATTTCQDIQNE